MFSFESTSLSPEPVLTSWGPKVVGNVNHLPLPHSHPWYLSAPIRTHPPFRQLYCTLRKSPQISMNVFSNIKYYIMALLNSCCFTQRFTWNFKCAHLFHTLKSRGFETYFKICAFKIYEEWVCDPIIVWTGLLQLQSVSFITCALRAFIFLSLSCSSTVTSNSKTAVNHFNVNFYWEPNMWKTESVAPFTQRLQSSAARMSLLFDACFFLTLNQTTAV